MMVRPLKAEDATAAMEILHGAVCYLKAQGIDQWQKGYPNIDQLNQDIDNQVVFGLFDDDLLCGVITLIYGADPNYVNDPTIWKTQDDQYVTIHRIATIHDGIHHGLGHRLFDFAIRHAKAIGATSVRCDTHKENAIMRHLMENHGFIYCGEIILATSGDPRVAYECVL